MSFPRSCAPLLALGASLGAAVFFRGKLVEERLTLGLIPPALRENSPARAGAVAGSQAVLVSAGLGVLRAVALDFLWLRAVHLQERGEYFEAGALAKLITALEPRFPAVWSFQAQNLAYNIPPSFPLRERYPWVVQAIQLLRDGALLHNPESPEAYFELAFIFQHKIGLDFDDAGYLYRSSLAAAFDSRAPVEQGAEQGAEQLAARRREWKLDAEKVKSLETKLASTLDFRAAESHALYWAELGLSRSPEPGSWFHRRLEYVRVASLRQLFDGGRPVRSADGSLYAFLPDLRFLDVTERALRDDIARAGSAADRLPALAAFEATAAVYLFLAGDEPGARLRFEQAKADLQPAPPTLEDLLARWITGEGQRSGESAIDDCLDASLLLERSGERAFAGGLKKLARLLDARRTGAAPATFDERLRAAEARRNSGAFRELPFRIELLAASDGKPGGAIPPGATRERD
jgi:hypothetical protein